MNSTSASLLERISSGTDRGDWDRFVDLYTPLLVAWCRRAGMTDTDVADFTQDVLLVLIEQLPRFRYDASRSFRAWLKTILLNAWRQRLIKAGRINDQVTDLDQFADSDPGVLLEETEHRDHLVRRALMLMQKDFEATTWKACWEFVVNSRPPSEVAAELGISINAVYLAKSRVLRHLRTELQGFLD
jgi:RNA polymerase sigma-70 factor, ECF subfamily